MVTPAKKKPIVPISIGPTLDDAPERRRLRALAVIAKAKQMAGSDSLASLTAADFKNPQFASSCLAPEPYKGHP